MDIVQAIPWDPLQMLMLDEQADQATTRDDRAALDADGASTVTVSNAVVFEGGHGVSQPVLSHRVSASASSMRLGALSHRGDDDGAGGGAGGGAAEPGRVGRAAAGAASTPHYEPGHRIRNSATGEDVYVVDRRLGAGAFADVYLVHGAAHSERTRGRKYAMKVGAESVWQCRSRVHERQTEGWVLA